MRVLLGSTAKMGAGTNVQDRLVALHAVSSTHLPGFLPENPLKNAEMMLEDDYGMIDGLINTGAKEPTVAELEQQARSCLLYTSRCV